MKVVDEPVSSIFFEENERKGQKSEEIIRTDRSALRLREMDVSGQVG